MSPRAKKISLDPAAGRQQMHIVITGHVDHGKSTIIGRLLAETDSLPHGKLDQVRETCRRNAKPFEYAFLLDALKAEQAQGITIDAARVFFKTAQRDYIIIDAPGHIEFLKNMVTGASRAEAAVLVIDAEEGIQENSRRHGYMISMLGLRQLIVVINKMDLVAYSQQRYSEIVEQYRAFLSQIGLQAEFIPVSGMGGDNLAALGDHMKWFEGKTLLQALDGLAKEAAPVEKPLRMPVQDVYKFTEYGDKRRIIAGTIQTGKLAVGDEVIFYPSGKRSIVRTLEGFPDSPGSGAEAGQAVAFTLDKQLYVSRGEMATVAGQGHPHVSTRLEANLFWMGRQPMVKGKSYLIKLGTAKEKVELEEVISVMDGSNLDASQKKDQVDHHDVARCILRTRKGIAFDAVDRIAQTGRFVIVDDFEISGGGIVRKSLEDQQHWVRDYVFHRNVKWEVGLVGREQRSERYNQRPAMVLLTGPKEVDKKSIARALESRLFADGKIVYFLGIANILYGVDADIKKPGLDENPEHLRRLAEVANVLLDAGMILVVTATNLTRQDLEIITAAVDVESVYVAWIGGEPTDIPCNLVIPTAVKPDDDRGVQEVVQEIKVMLQNAGVIFRP